jgi:hypothetical protein
LPRMLPSTSRLCAPPCLATVLVNLRRRCPEEYRLLRRRYGSTTPLYSQHDTNSSDSVRDEIVAQEYLTPL